MASNMSQNQMNLSGRSASEDRTPLPLQAMNVLQRFRTSNDAAAYREASFRWAQLRPKMVSYEKAVRCNDSGASSDRQMAIGIVDDLTKAPIELLMSIAQLILSFSVREKDGVGDALEDCYQNLIKEGIAWSKDKSSGKAKVALDASAKRLREILIKYLQTVSSRSRKHFAEIIDGSLAVLVGLGGATARVAGIVFSPTRITPEWCGLMKNIDDEQRAAFARVFPVPSSARQHSR